MMITINNQNKADLFTSAKGNTTMVAASNDGKTKRATRPEDEIVDNGNDNDANDDDDWKQTGKKMTMVKMMTILMVMMMTMVMEAM